MFMGEIYFFPKKSEVGGGYQLFLMPHVSEHAARKRVIAAPEWN